MLFIKNNNTAILTTIIMKKQNQELYLWLIIRLQREKADMKIRELARLSWVAYPQISAYENWRTQVKEEVLINTFLVKWFNMRYNEANNLVQEFKINMAQQKMSPKVDSISWNTSTWDNSAHVNWAVFWNVIVNSTERKIVEKLVDNSVEDKKMILSLMQSKPKKKDSVKKILNLNNKELEDLINIYEYMEAKNNDEK